MFTNKCTLGMKHLAHSYMMVRTIKTASSKGKKENWTQWTLKTHHFFLLSEFIPSIPYHTAQLFVFVWIESL
jgi:hypothetical protein